MLAKDLIFYLKIKKVNGNIDLLNIEYITQDSRDLRENSMFICIKGDRVDGHNFVEKLDFSKVKLIVASDDISDKVSDTPVVYVKDTLKVMGILANVLYNCPSEKLFMVGITGTNGKTTTSHILSHILENNNMKTGIIGTIHHKIGDKIIPTKNTTPISVDLQKILNEMVEENCNGCVMEVSSHALALDRVIGCSFDVAIFTNLSHEHLELHKTMENYARTKELLFSQLGHSLKNGKCRTAVFNLDDKNSKTYIEHTPCEVVTYAINDKTADFFADGIYNENNKTYFNLHFQGETYKVESNLIGIFNVYNLLAGISAGFVSGLSIEDIINSIKTFEGVDGRMQRVQNDKNLDVIIDFAHTPDGLNNVLDTLKSSVNGKIITVLGHSGGNRDSSMRPDLGKIALEKSDFVILTADNPRNEKIEKICREMLSKTNNNNYTIIEKREDAIREALKIALEKDVVLLAGKGAEPYQVIGEEYIPYSEIEVVKEILKEI